MNEKLYFFCKNKSRSINNILSSRNKVKNNFVYSSNKQNISFNNGSDLQLLMRFA